MIVAGSSWPPGTDGKGKIHTMSNSRQNSSCAVPLRPRRDSRRHLHQRLRPPVFYHNENRERSPSECQRNSTSHKPDLTTPTDPSCTRSERLAAPPGLPSRGTRLWFTAAFTASGCDPDIQGSATAVASPTPPVPANTW